MQSQSIPILVLQGLVLTNPAASPCDEVARNLVLTTLLSLPVVHCQEVPVRKCRAIAAAATELVPLSRWRVFALKARLSEKIGVDASSDVGYWSNDVLTLIARVVFEPGAQAIIVEHSFGVLACGDLLRW